jgi:uncharacterized protein YndB with AHSA1/START domain
METTNKTELITVQTTVAISSDKIWQLWTDPEHVKNWNFATNDWHTLKATNELREGGKFLYRMESKDGISGFDFEGTYTEIVPFERIAYQMTDGRNVTVEFISENESVSIIEKFEPDTFHSTELQQIGWQAILDNFKKYAEASSDIERMHFEIFIKCSQEEVYRTMLDKRKYSRWASAFNPSSYYTGSWETGSEIRFLGTDRDGITGGMISRVMENIPGKYISIKHIGVLQDDNVMTTGPEVEKWAGTFENYSFTQADGGTLVFVDVDVSNEFRNYFIQTWPLALKRLKEICEQK